MSIEPMLTTREKINLFYYNIFRFERYTQYLFSAPLHGAIRAVGLGDSMAKRSGKENWDEYILEVLNNPKGGMSLHLTGIHIALLVMLVLLTLLNILCGLLGLSIHTFWFYGMLAASILTVAISNYIAPTNTKKYLKDFRNFERMPKGKKRRSAFLTLLLVIGAWSAFVTSFILYLRVLISAN